MVRRELIGRSDMGNSTQQKMIGRSVRRLEDARFLTGRGRYVDDIVVADCLYGHVLRSPHAHALIKRIDVSPAARARRRARRLHPADLAADGLGPHALPGGGEAADRAAAAGAGRSAACAMSAIRWPSSSPTARRSRARRPSWSRSTTRRCRRRRRPCGARRRRAGDLGRGAGQSRLPRPARATPMPWRRR